MKSLRALGCLLLLLLAGRMSGAETVTKMPAPTAYVNDFAKVMTPDGKSQVEAICREVHDKTKAQIFFVTINSLDGESIEMFANDLFHNWKIGEKGIDRGILLLLAVKDHKRRIEVGYGFEGILPDAKTGRIGMDMVPALQAANYDEAARAGVTEIANVIAEDSKVTLDSVGAEPAHLAGDETPQVTGPSIREIQSGRWIFIGAFLVLSLGPIAFFFVMVMARKRLVRSSGGRVGFFPAGGTDSSDNDSSSSFSSGSDDSFSGGDGGDSGGGGSSGSW